MKNKLKILLSVLLLIINIIHPQNIAHAAELPNCEFKDTDPLEFIINNFESPEELKKHELIFDCVGNNCSSNALKNFWTLFKTQRLSLRDNTYWQNEDGTYSTGFYLYDWDESVTKTIKQCLHPKIVDILASEPGCIAGVSLGITAAIFSAGIVSWPVAIAVGSCGVDLFADNETELLRTFDECEPKFKAVVQKNEFTKNYCRVDFGYDIMYEFDQTTVFDACRHITDPILQEKCATCMGQEGSGSNGSVWTGLGCLSFSPSGFIRQVLQIAIGLGGGIAFLLLLYGAFLMTTASGNPEAADNAKQIITGAITGLLVIIFSVVILNIIGVQILQIPGL